jgi:hypothetical protein
MLEAAVAYARSNARIDLHEEEGYDSKPSGRITSRGEAAGQSRDDNVRNQHDDSLKVSAADLKRRCG